jgi:hypothetical protein
VLIDNHWEPYFFGLNTIEWPRAQWINFVVLSSITLTICSQLTYNTNTQERIINELSTKWIWYKKDYCRISRGEKLMHISGKEIEKHKYNEEATPHKMNSVTLKHLF